ncbi:hypothetical protein [Erwinia amylovora]|uniref:hypothetical protein n=1 Tax=Erwinia amylovora TaxID=552 RepID=UPI00144451E6|nr:hypothetical protein [Erwinia amylovora]
MDLVDNASFTASMNPGAMATRAIRYHLAASEQSIDWTCLSPAAFPEPRPRTAKFRPGSTTLLMNGDKPAAYGVADLSAALLDELEPPWHVYQHFTFGGSSSGPKLAARSLYFEKIKVSPGFPG